MKRCMTTIGWALFLGNHIVADNLNNFHSDTMTLFGYDLKNYVGIVNRIKAFIGRITHSIGVDMVRI